jgi:RNA polymerase sigma factor (sigma-70 family)
VDRSHELIERQDEHGAVARPADARSEAFVRLADQHLDRAYGRAWGTLRDPARFEPWFDRILINTCRNRLRSRREATDISEEIAFATGDAYRQADDRDALGGAIAALSPDHKVVIALRFYRDLAVEDIAVRLGIPAGTVRSRLHYALRQLHDFIDATTAEGSIR